MKILRSINSSIEDTMKYTTISISLGKKKIDINIMELEIQIYVQKYVWINVDNLGTIKDIVEGDWVK